jgi:DNA invertase Pin-like site-specific DNA recombinase
MEAITRDTTSQKVERALRDQGRSKRWLARQLEISVGTLYNRLNDNLWSAPELMMLQSLLNID